MLLFYCCFIYYSDERKKDPLRVQYAPVLTGAY